MVDGTLKPWLKLTHEFATQSVKDQVRVLISYTSLITRQADGDKMVRVQANLVEKMFANLRSVLLTAAHCRQPEQKALEDILKPLTVDIGEITKAKEANRKDREWFNHLSVVAEGAPCVGWVASVSLSQQLCIVWGS